MPVRVDQRRGAGLVELGSLGLGEAEGGGRQVVGQLLRGARADDQRGDGRFAQEVGESHLRGRDAVLLAEADQDLDDVIQALLVVDRRLTPVGELPRARRGLVVPAVLTGQQAAGQRAPDQNAQALVDRQRDQLVLGLAGLQRVVDLLADELRQAQPLGRAQCLHQLPRGVVGGADVTDLARGDQPVQRVQRLLKRGLAVPLVHLVKVDVVGAQAAQAGLAAGNDVVAGQPGVVRAAPHRHPHLGGHQHLVPAARQDLAQDFLGLAAGVDVGGIDEVDPGVQAHIHLPPGLGHVGRPDVFEWPAAAERHRAHGEHGNPQARPAQRAIFHRPTLLTAVRRGPSRPPRIPAGGARLDKHAGTPGAGLRHAGRGAHRCSTV